MSRLLTPAQQRECLIGLGWPLDRPAHGTSSSLFWAIVAFQEACTYYDGKVDGVWGRRTQLAAYVSGSTGGRLSENFTAREFACRCWERGYHRGFGYCQGWITVKRPLVVALEAWRERVVRRPVSIINGFRCEAYNAKVGGASRSQHPKGLAVDVPILTTVAPTKAAAIFTGIGYQRRGRGVRHLDMRPGSPHSPAEWAYG